MSVLRRLDVRDWLELAGLGLVVVFVALMWGLWALLVGGAVVVYLSHAWEWDGAVEPAQPEAVAAPPVIVKQRTAA